MRTRCITIWLLGVAALLLLEAAPAAAAPIWSFDTIPTGGAISAAPGQTVGWGYIISNMDSSNWLVVTGLDAAPFSFADASLPVPFDFPIVPPNTTITTSYTPGTAGLYEVTVKPLALPSFELGAFTVTADWYDGNPFEGGMVSFSNQTLETPASLAVTAPAPPSVPEPSTWLLLLIGVGGVMFLERLALIQSHRRRPMKRRLAVLLIVAAALPLLAVDPAMAGGGFNPPPFPNGFRVTGPAVEAVIVMDAHDASSFPNRDSGATPPQASIKLERKHKHSGAIFTLPAFPSFFTTFGCDASRTKARFVTTSTNFVPLVAWIPEAIVTQIFADLGISVTGSLIPIITHVEDAVCTADPTNPGPGSGTPPPLPGTLSFEAVIQFAVPKP